VLSMPTMHWRLSVSLCFTAALAALLSGCAMSADSFSSFLVAPGGYVLYSCDDIARTAKGVEARQKELEQLMAKTGTEAGGRLIADATYGADYATARGQMRDLREAAADKKCNFVPGVETPPAPASKATIQ